MRSPYYAAAGALALALLAACEDAPPPESAVAPTTESSRASLLTPASGPNLAADINKQIASVCKSYRKAAAQAKKDLFKNPDDEQLKADVAAYAALIDDACN